MFQGDALKAVCGMPGRMFQRDDLEGVFGMLEGRRSRGRLQDAPGSCGNDAL